MKNHIKAVISRPSMLSLFAIAVILFSISSIEKEKQKLTYQELESNVTISGAANSESWRIVASAIDCEGAFEVDDHHLMTLSDLNFEVPISQFKSNNHQMETLITDLFRNSKIEKIGFKQKYGMVLPIMQKIHVIGELNILNGCRTTPMMVSYELNSDQTLRIKGKQSFLLSQFGIKLPANSPGIIDEEVNFEIDILLKNKKSEI